MRLLHTSDWHLGRTLHRADLRDAQAGFLDGLIDTARRERVDVVLVAGDVYDRAVPSLDAVELCEQALVRLRETGARVVVISGNHDSARRLGFGSRLVDAAGVHLRTDVAQCATPMMISDQYGEVAVYGLPYLEPAAVRDALPPAPPDRPAAPKRVARPPDSPVSSHEQPSSQPVDPLRSHAGVLGRAMSCVRADLAKRGNRSVVVAHAWVHGGAASDSERDITVGGAGAVPAALFDGINYTALGHLHGPQVLRDGLRYSGSPLAYSFSEAAHRKGSWLVELDAAGAVRAEQVPAPVPRRLSRLRGTLDELLTDRRYVDHEPDWLSVVLTDPARPSAAMDRLSARFHHVLVLDWEPEGGLVSGGSYGARVAGRSDLEVTAEFVQHVRRTPADPVERALLAQALEAGRLAAASA